MWAEDAVWADSNLLIAPFGEVLNDRLVAQPAVTRNAAARLFRHLNVIAVSQVTRLKLAATPDNLPAPEITQRLRERSDLLLWLSPNAEFRDGLRKLLGRVEIRLTQKLLVHSEMTAFDPPVPSPIVSAPSFLDDLTDVIHVRAVETKSMDWPSVFRALFARLEGHTHGVEMPPIVMAATLVAMAQTWEDAEQALLQSDYRAPVDAYSDLPRGEVLGNAEDEPEEETNAFDREDWPGQPGENDQDSRPEDLDKAAYFKEDNDGRGDQRNERDTGERLTSKEPGSSGGDLGVSSRPGSGVGAVAASGGTNATGALNTEKPFGSKAADGSFGAEPSQPGDARSALSGAGPRSTLTGGSQGASQRQSGLGGETRTERHARRSRMLAYVAPASKTADRDRRTGDDDDISEQIDVAAIVAALKYEQARGWSPVEQPHGNPGYDIISTATTGTSRRLIEVKGLENDWTERGIKLSHVQYGMAESHPDEFWIYIVENARDRQRQRVTAIANPFSKVVEYWFDDRWRAVSEETAASSTLNIRVGARVRHNVWGVGNIVTVVKRGAVPFLTIDFGVSEGRRGIPLSSSLEFID